MATYKVPQDVEADDKLLGPFTFRQFIYLIIVALTGFIAYWLGTIFIVLAIIPVPIILFFGVLALPLRKDQPMETYIAAMISFYLKPRRRLWDPEGQESTIEITAPKVVETVLTKDLSRGEAEKRFSYLAQIVDSQGWSVRGPGVQAPNSSMTSDAYYEAQQAEDFLDSNSSMMQSFNDKLDRSDSQHKRNVIDLMKKESQAPNYFSEQPTVEPTQDAQPAQDTTQDITTPATDDNQQPVNYNPYPEDMRQAVVQPASTSKKLIEEEPIKEQPSENPPSADIINLANNADLSIATIAHEANRIKDKQGSNGEVFVSLR